MPTWMNKVDVSVQARTMGANRCKPSNRKPARKGPVSSEAKGPTELKKKGNPRGRKGTRPDHAGKL